MRLAAVLLLIAACEKQGPVESTPGSASSSGGTETPVVKSVDAGVATIGTDAAPVAPAPADAAVVVVTPDAARRRNIDRATIAEEDARAMANLLAIEGPDTGEVDMSRRRPGANLSRQLDDVRRGGGSVAIGGSGGRGTRGDGDARTSTGSGPKVDSSGSATPSDTPSGRISIASKQAFDDTTLTPDMVLMKIQSTYMAGIKRCYKTQLKQDPALRGKIKLGITVNESGRSVAPKANGFSSAIDSCLTSMMSSWRFSIPNDKDGEATEANFEIGLQLVPD